MVLQSWNMLKGYESRGMVTQSHTGRCREREVERYLYATSKDRRAHRIIEEKGLNIRFKAITFGTYGAFGTATHKLIATATASIVAVAAATAVGALPPFGPSAGVPGADTLLPAVHPHAPA